MLGGSPHDNLSFGRRGTRLIPALPHLELGSLESVTSTHSDRTSIATSSSGEICSAAHDAHVVIFGLKISSRSSGLCRII